MTLKTSEAQELQLFLKQKKLLKNKFKSVFKAEEQEDSGHVIYRFQPVDDHIIPHWDNIKEQLINSDNFQKLRKHIFFRSEFTKIPNHTFFGNDLRFSEDLTGTTIVSISSRISTFSLRCSCSQIVLSKCLKLLYRLYHGKSQSDTIRSHKMPNLSSKLKKIKD